MKEYFVVANSNAAPFFSDESTHYVSADSPESALGKFMVSYTHPCGLYSANVYANADAYHKHTEPLAIYRSPKAQKQWK